MKNITKIAIRHRSASAAQIDYLKSTAKGFGLQTVIATHESGDGDLDGAGLIIAVGGDGNFISTCRLAAGKNVPVFGIHTGHLGFLTGAVLEEFGEFLREFLDGRCWVQSVRFLKAEFIKDGVVVRENLAFNDVVLARFGLGAMVDIAAFIDNNHFNSYRGDGVIISSAAGSTAYNLSSGGTIIHPAAQVFGITPICSHSLAQRGLIMPSSLKVEFKDLSKNVIAMIDGQGSVRDFDSVKIGLSGVEVALLRRAQWDYFGVLKQKLRWGQDD